LTTRDRTVLDATLEVRAGEIVGVAGLVGCGKSELALALAGAVPADGEIKVNSRPVNLRSPRSAMDAGIGFTPEDRKRSSIFPTRSVLQNLSAAWASRLTRLGVINVGNERAMANEAIRRFGVKASSLRSSIVQLSGGNQQKVVLGRCFALAPGVVVLSEPTRGIDVGAKSEVYQIIQDMAEAGTGVLMVSSEMPELLGLTDRILVMFRGRIEAEFVTAQATEEGIAAIALGHNIEVAVA
jgi:ABC-type sugar transport system ATPase subunit